MLNIDGDADKVHDVNVEKLCVKIKSKKFKMVLVGKITS